MRLVVDASIVIKWVVPEKDSQHAEALLDHELIAPELLIPECANVLWRKTVRGELAPAAAEAAAKTIELAGIELLSTSGMLRDIFVLARDLNHAAYDCTYLALAIALDLPMVTADVRFAERCAKLYDSPAGPRVRQLGSSLLVP